MIAYVISFLEAVVVDKHAIPEAIVRDVASCHFVLGRVHLAVLLLAVLLFRVLLGFLIHRRRGSRFTLLVCLNIEVAEQEVKHDRVHSDPPDKHFRVVAFDEEKLESVEYHKNELHHLQGGQIFLPPEVRLYLGPEGGQKVVRVHHDMYKCVEHAEERAVTARRKFHTEPNGYWHNSVMNHVQSRDLTILFSQHEEYGVKEFSKLGEVVPPAAVCHSQCPWTV